MEDHFHWGYGFVLFYPGKSDDKRRMAVCVCLLWILALEKDEKQENADTHGNSLSGGDFWHLLFI